MPATTPNGPDNAMARENGPHLSGDKSIDQYRLLHAKGGYGNTSIKNLAFILPHIAALKPASIIDFGCGRSSLIDALDLPGVSRRERYDPAVPEYARRPTGPFDLLLNVDVLEHVPESVLPDVLADMRSMCRNAMIVVDTRPAATILPNGENAHCTLHDHAWWGETLSAVFGPLRRIRVARRGRAAFITWNYGRGEALAIGARVAAGRLYRVFGGRAGADR
jgi:hypothetical protein